MSIFDSGIKIYKSEWTEVKARKFDDTELSQINDATVVASKYGRSVCFSILNKGKAFIPMEPLAEGNIGDTLNPANLQIVNLKYTGNNPEQKIKDIIRVRTCNNEDIQVDNFDNPFGI